MEVGRPRPAFACFKAIAAPGVRPAYIATEITTPFPDPPHTAFPARLSARYCSESYP
jgi:hypothetical protein